MNYCAYCVECLNKMLSFQSSAMMTNGGEHRTHSVVCHQIRRKKVRNELLQFRPCDVASRSTPLNFGEWLPN